MNVEGYDKKELFNKFKEEFPNWKKDFGVEKVDSEQYQRIIINCKEIHNGKELFHQYAATINVENGDIYLDCHKSKIMAKHFVLALYRPLHTIIAKTAYHASGYPVAKAIFKYLKSEQTETDLAKLRERAIKSTEGLIASPVYGSVITLVHVAGLVLGAVAPNTVYKTREIAGNLELDFNRLRDKGKLKRERKDSEGEDIEGKDLIKLEQIYLSKPWLVAPCFSPMRNLADMYIHTGDETPRMLEKFAESQIRFRKNNRALFNDYFMMYPKDREYNSRVLKNRRRNAISQPSEEEAKVPAARRLRAEARVGKEAFKLPIGNRRPRATGMSKPVSPFSEKALPLSPSVGQDAVVSVPVTSSPRAAKARKPVVRIQLPNTIDLSELNNLKQKMEGLSGSELLDLLESEIKAYEYAKLDVSGQQEIKKHTLESLVQLIYIKERLNSFTSKEATDKVTIKLLKDRIEQELKSANPALKKLAIQYNKIDSLLGLQIVSIVPEGKRRPKKNAAKSKPILESAGASGDFSISNVKVALKMLSQPKDIFETRKDLNLSLSRQVYRLLDDAQRAKITSLENDLDSAFNTISPKNKLNHFEKLFTNFFSELPVIGSQLEESIDKATSVMAESKTVIDAKFRDGDVTASDVVSYMTSLNEQLNLLNSHMVKLVDNGSKYMRVMYEYEVPMSNLIEDSKRSDVQNELTHIFDLGRKLEGSAVYFYITANPQFQRISKMELPKVINNKFETPMMLSLDNEVIKGVVKVNSPKEYKEFIESYRQYLKNLEDLKTNSGGALQMIGAMGEEKPDYHALPALKRKQAWTT